MKGDSEAIEVVNRLLKAILKKMETLDSRLKVMESKAEMKKSMVELSKLKEVDNYYTYADAFEEWASKVKLSDEDLVARFVEGLKKNHKLIAILNPRTLQQAISYGRAITVDINPKAAGSGRIGSVVELGEPKDRLGRKEPRYMSNTREGIGCGGDLQPQPYYKPIQIQKHRSLIYQPPHKRSSPDEMEVKKPVDNFKDKDDKDDRVETVLKDFKEDEPVDQPKVEKEMSVVPHGLFTVVDVMKGKEESVPKRSLCNKAKEFEFQVEGSRLMNIHVNSLCNDKDKEVFGDNSKREIHIRVDKDKKILIIRDKGAGMTKENLIESLGTMARSGVLASVGKMHTSGDLDQSGQFVVGFFSVHLIAEKAEVNSEHNGDKQYIWKSEADWVFAISEDTWQEPLAQGTEIRLHLREEAGKYPLGHKYTNKRPNYMSGEPEGERYSTKEEWILEEKVSLNPIGSIHAYYEVHMLPMNQTLKMKGYYKKMRLRVLVNSDSTHNFLEAAIAKGGGCQWQQVEQQKGSQQLWQQNLDGDLVGQWSLIWQSPQTNHLLSKRKRETETVAGRSGPSGVNQNAEVIKIGYKYPEVRTEFEESNWERGNIEVIISIKDMAEEGRRLN